MKLDDYGSFIKHHRLASGYKFKRDLAEATGVSESTISRAEANKHKPSPETIQALAKKLTSTNLNELLNACGYFNYEETSFDANDSNYAENRNKYYGALRVKEAPSQYVTEKELDLLSRLKELAAELNLDLSDPGTFDTIKDAVNLIKRVRGE